MSRISDRRKGGSAKAEGGAHWMDTYGDLVTLLLTFFVMLYAFSTLNTGKFAAFADALTGNSSVDNAAEPEDITTSMAFYIPPNITSIPPLSVADAEEVDEIPAQSPLIDESRLMEMAGSVQRFLNDNYIEADMSVDEAELALILTFNDQIFFGSGDAAILPTAVPVLEDMIELFARYSDMCEIFCIEGHTDNVQISTSQYPSNWELSVARATNVLRYIVESGRVDPSQFTVGGYGEYHPVASNDTDEGRALNRRVDFIIKGIKP